MSGSVFIDLFQALNRAWKKNVYKKYHYEEEKNLYTEKAKDAMLFSYK
jgi:hypothetical protein